MFSLTGRTLCGVGVFASHTPVRELSSPVSGGGEMESGGPPLHPLVSVFLSYFFASRLAAREAGQPGAGRGGAAVRVGEGTGRDSDLLFTGDAGCLGWGWTGD